MDSLLQLSSRERAEVFQRTTQQTGFDAVITRPALRPTQPEFTRGGEHQVYFHKGKHLGLPTLPCGRGTGAVSYLTPAEQVPRLTPASMNLEQTV